MQSNKSYPAYQYSLIPNTWRSPSPKGHRLHRRSALIPVLAVCVAFILCICWLSNLLDTTFEPPSPPSCDPWQSYGHLNVNTDVPEENVWRPYPWLQSTPSPDAATRACTPPPLMRALRESLNIRSSGLQPYPPSLSDELLPFLHNRTVLLVGDSVTRNTVQQFCELLGKESIKIERGHTWDLFDQIPQEWIPAEWAERENWEDWLRDKENMSRPRVCYIPEWDFAIVSIFHWGMDDTDYWRTKDQYNPPGLLEQRMQVIAIPLLERLALPETEGGLAPHARSAVPDLIEISSTLWDVAKWARDDLDAHEMTITDLSSERLEWWRQRVAAVVREAKDIWPTSTLVWKSSHWPSDGSAKIDWFMGWSWDNPDAHRPFFHHNRLLQLDHAARSLFLPQPWHLENPQAYQSWKRNSRRNGLDGVGYSNWGNLLLGQHAHQQDQLHPGALPAAYLWGDMLLYQLRQATGFPTIESDGHLPLADK
ncbi:hypothetical protein CALVIDRAFT_529306 [Calocera viscosa TUFC12733]|uniref:Uncharacterized protein n=1 Tax=Calocera viscosa (strain TUFC12733) TaxID=1330018 RepID=A0A167JRJ8_CALVF|nr:hypothetical protein CALVIDRAFT_529306 [Calocera viscosa TUFC12733]